MSDGNNRSWSPPLEAQTRTLTTITVTRAKPKHVKDIHNLQLLAYPGRVDFHESEDVFRSKIEAYPAGNFVALAMYSVVTDDDTTAWTKQHNSEQHEEDSQEEEEEEEEEAKENGVGDDALRHEISVVEITETAPDGTTTATTTTNTGGHEEQTVHVIRARTPDITEGDGSNSRNKVHREMLSSSSTFPSTLPESSKADSHTDATSKSRASELEEGFDDEDEEPTTTVLFQWEKPVGYLFSHPYSRESVTLHRLAKVEDIPSKRTKVDPALGGETEYDDEDPYEHDQLMEKYYIHDCAIHPDWRGKGLASKLWKALEDSLLPSREGDESRSIEGDDLVDTEEDEEDEKKAETTEASSSSSKPSRRNHHHGSRRSRGRKHQKGAPNLKDIVLVSVQGTRPFWQRAGGFQVVQDHDIDLSVYGDEAFFMSKPFTF